MNLRRSQLPAILSTLFLFSAVTASAGTIEGTVTVLRKNSETPLKSFEDTAVFLKGDFGSVPAEDAVLSQYKKRFSPRILVAMKGQPIVFKNDDRIKHNIFSTDLNFDIGYIGHEDEVIKDFSRTGMYKVYCNIHKDMVADLIISGNPYNATTDESGSFSISGVPPGEYTLSAAHIYGGTAEVPVTVTEGVTEVELTLQSTLVIRQILDHTNKYGDDYDDDGY